MGNQADTGHAPRKLRRLAAIQKRIDSAQAQLKRANERLSDARWEWEDRILAAFKSGDLAWRYQHPLKASAAHGATLSIYNDEPVDSNFYLRGSLHSERKRGDGVPLSLPVRIPITKLTPSRSSRARAHGPLWGSIFSRTKRSRAIESRAARIVSC